MTEEVQAAEANQEVTAAPEAAVSSQETEKARNYESEAREMGWVPETEFKGDKEKWKPAQKFVEDGEKILPIVRSQLKRTQDEMAKKEADFAKRLERMERMSNSAIERLKAQHKADLERIQTAKEAAVEAGDLAEYRKLDKQEKDLSSAKIEEPAVEKADPGTIFKEKNPWYGEDEDLTAFADGVSQSLAAKNPQMTLEENLRQTAEKVKAAFPTKFGEKKPAANGHAAVDGGGDFPNASQKPGPASKLPAEARKQAESDVKSGLYKNVDDWAKVYFGQ